MKKFIILFTISLFGTSLIAQDITNTIGSGGKFEVFNNDGSTTLLSVAKF